MYCSSLKPSLPCRHLLGISELCVSEIICLLDLAEKIRNGLKPISELQNVMRGLVQVNLFFESSTRTQASFDVAGKRLGADVINMPVATSSVSKGESLIDTVRTLSLMRPDVLVVRHFSEGAIHILSNYVSCSIINAGDGVHEHPTQALLDALTIRCHKGEISGLNVSICGDILHSRVARSNIFLLNALGAHVRLVGPSTLIPLDVEHMSVEVHTNMQDGLEDADVIMVLRMQHERMSSGLVPSMREYFHFWGLTEEKLAYAKPDALVMHPGPVNYGIEIAYELAVGPRSLIAEQVENGVAVRMAVLKELIDPSCFKGSAV